MARKTTAVEEEIADMTLLTQAPDDWEFETVVEESPTRIIFDEVGDKFIGRYVGVEHIVPDNGDEPFDLYTFRGQDGKLYSVNKSYKLANAMEDKVKVDDWVRITLVKEIDSKKGNPMKDFRVEVKRN